MRYLSVFVLSFSVLLSGQAMAELKLNLNPYPTQQINLPAAPQVMPSQETQTPTPLPDDFLTGEDVPPPLMPPQDLLQVPSSVRVPAVSSESSTAIRAGQDLHVLLQTWAKSNNVDFIWDAGERRFFTNRTVRVSGQFEESVGALLDQFVGHEPRPVATLYTEKANRPATLVVSLKN